MTLRVLYINGDIEEIELPRVKAEAAFRTLTSLNEGWAHFELPPVGKLGINRTRVMRVELG